MFVAGDMASNDDYARGWRSDDVPDLRLFKGCQGELGEFHFVYGNHDNEIPADWMPVNGNGTPAMLPDGRVIASEWSIGGRLQIGGVHGIPGKSDGWKKRDRREYYTGLRKVCNSADIVITHHNPALPFQTHLLDEGEPKSDARDIFRIFSEGAAQLLVNGHSQTSEVVTVLPNGKVVVNSDHRVVVLMPFAIAEPEVEVPYAVVVDEVPIEKELKKMEKTLREISRLEERREAGEKLEDTQMRKCDRKEDVLRQVHMLEAQLAARHSSKSEANQAHLLKQELEVVELWEDLVVELPASLEVAQNKSEAAGSCADLLEKSPETLKQAETTTEKLCEVFADLPEPTQGDGVRAEAFLHQGTCIVGGIKTDMLERKLKKKLRQIDALMEKEQQGELLRNNRMEKVETRASVEAQLALLQPQQIESSNTSSRMEQEAVYDVAKDFCQAPRKPDACQGRRWNRR
jgi:hypothetical protein